MSSSSPEETKGLVKKVKGSSPPSSPKGSSSSTSLFWNLLAFVVLGLTLIFACDVLEFNHNNNIVSGGGRSGGNTSPGATKTSFAGESVVLKPKISAGNQQAGEPTLEESSDDTASQTAATSSPIAVPKTSEPTNKDTEAPQSKENHGGKNSNQNKDSDVPPMDVKDDSENEKNKETEVDNQVDPTITTTPSMGVGNPTRHTYNRRGQPMNDKDQKEMVKKWGSWTLVDDKKNQRPQEDFYAVYPNRDVPRKDFPKNAWQVDKDYLAKFVPEGLKMVTRAYDAILEEYGLDDNEINFFHVEKFDEFPDIKGQRCLHLGGCTTTKTWENLKRRLLHAVMTEDVFVFAMGGHSSAAGVSTCW